MALLPSLSQYSGQTVFDGVMIRGRSAVSIAVREPNGWVVTRSAAAPERTPAPLRRLPFVRGLLALVEALWLVAPALQWSSNVSGGKRRRAFSALELVLPALALVGTIVAFVAVPHLVRAWLPAHFPAGIEIATEFAVRGLLVAGYGWFVLRGSALEQALSYHAAEHQALNAYERGGDLTLDTARQCSTSSRHCSIGFLLLTGVAAMLALPLIPGESVWLRTTGGLLLLPALAAIAFEGWRLDGARAGFPHDLLARPADWLHGLTVRQAAEAHLEVALAALRGAIEFESIVSEPLSRAVALLQGEHEAS